MMLTRDMLKTLDYRREKSNLLYDFTPIHINVKTHIILSSKRRWAMLHSKDAISPLTF